MVLRQICIVARADHLGTTCYVGGHPLHGTHTVQTSSSEPRITGNMGELVGCSPSRLYIEKGRSKDLSRINISVCAARSLVPAYTNTLGFWHDLFVNVNKMVFGG